MFWKVSKFASFSQKNEFEFVKQILHLQIFEPPRRFDLGLLETLIFQYGENILENFMICLVFPEKWFCIHSPNLVFSSLVPIFNGSEGSM